MSNRLRGALAVALSVLPFVAGAQRSENSSAPIKWSEQVGSGHWVNVSNVNGKVEVSQGSSDHVELTAVKHWRRGNPDNVRLETKKDGDDVVICALWEGQSTCSDDDRRHWNNDDSDVSIDFTILLPRGVKLRGATVNGSFSVRGATAEVRATSVNGSVDVETGGGPLHASTVNGTVTARLSGQAAGGDMEFSTVNGNVIVEVPSAFGADLEMTTVNGSLKSDFDMTIRGRIDPRRMNVHVGAAGGPQVHLSTVNGNIELRKH